MKPFSRFYVFIYYVVGFITAILHPATVEGMEKLPRSGVLLCPNHSSNWDPVLLGLKLPVNYRLHAMAKEELFKNPILGWIIRKLGAFPVSRGNNDIHRDVAPLRQAEDAVLLDTTDLDFQESKAALLNIIRKRTSL